jgi:hypothetical protein
MGKVHRSCWLNSSGALNLLRAARTTRRRRGQITVHLPGGWHREHDWMNLFPAACGPPAPAA